MSTPTLHRKPGDRTPLYDARYAQGNNGFCVRCQQDKSRAGGKMRAGMFTCAQCIAPKEAPNAA